MIKEHGGNIYGQSSSIIDFSANINPLGMPAKVKKAVMESIEKSDIYPDPECVSLRKSISDYEEVPYKKIVCGNGAADLIYRIVSALKPKEALITAPAFGEYRKALSEYGCKISEYLLYEDNDFIVDSKIVSCINDRTDIVFLCNPNNPTGRLIPCDVLEMIAKRCIETGTILVSDECFIGFTGKEETHSLKKFFNDNCIILKAFTKLFACAGLRAGYAVFGNSDLAEKVRGTGQYWSVSVPAQAVGIAAFQCDDFVKKTIEYICSERKYLEEQLTECGIRFFSSEANYILIKSFAGLDDMLLNSGIMIRNCGNYRGLSNVFYRIAVRTHSENLRLIETIKKIL